jgi:hypothetical protein
MVERRTELKRRYHRKKKLKKLKAKLAHPKDGRERENTLKKIRLISPHWTEGKPEGEAKPAPKPEPKREAKPAPAKK